MAFIRLMLVHCATAGVSLDAERAEYARPSSDPCAAGGGQEPVTCVGTSEAGCSGGVSLDLLQRSSRHQLAKTGRAAESPRGVFPLAWLHIPKCGSSLLNALVHVPGACPGVPEDVAISDTTMGADNCKGFWDKYPAGTACPGAFVKTHIGGHEGLGTSNAQYESVWKGHGVTMLRQPEQRLLSAFYDKTHSWPASPWNPPPRDVLTFARQVRGCAVRMLTRGGTSYQANFWNYGAAGRNYGAVGPHWGGPCGSGAPPTRAEVDKAKRRLRGFLFVGLVEEWELSMCLFRATFGGQCFASEFINTRHEETPRLEHDTSVLRGLTDEYDGALYAEAQAIFRERFGSLSLSEAACQPCFAQANVTYPPPSIHDEPDA